MGENSEAIKDVLTSMIPIYGTYKEGKEFIDNPSLGLGVATVVSGAADLASLLGVGLLGKGLLATSKAGKIGKALPKLYNRTLTLLNDNYGARKLFKRHRNALNSMSLLENIPTSKIIDRAKKMNDARDMIKTTGSLYKSALHLYNNTMSSYNLNRQIGKLAFKDATLFGVVGGTGLQATSGEASILAK